MNRSGEIGRSANEDAMDRQQSFYDDLLAAGDLTEREYEQIMADLRQPSSGGAPGEAENDGGAAKRRPAAFELFKKKIGLTVLLLSAYVMTAVSIGWDALWARLVMVGLLATVAFLWFPGSGILPLWMRRTHKE